MSGSAQGAAAKPVSFERERGVYKVLVTRDVAHAVVKVGDDEQRVERMMRVFRTLADESIPLFLIKLHRSAVTFAVDGMFVPRLETCIERAGFGIRTRRDLALLSVVASSMRDLTGVMVTIADSLQEAGARLYATGDSHNSVQCLIQGERVEGALGQLKLVFGLEDENE
jgi:aspartate kinase